MKVVAPPVIMHVGFHAPIALVTGTMTPVLSFGTSDMETFSMRALIAEAVLDGLMSL